MNTGEILKIMTISLMGTQRSKAYAVFNGEQLVISRVDPIAGMFAFWRKPIVNHVLTSFLITSLESQGRGR
jgi:hypothetical protein